jgi:hypothetical protein
MGGNTQLQPALDCIYEWIYSKDAIRQVRTKVKQMVYSPKGAQLLSLALHTKEQHFV